MCCACMCCIAEDTIGVKTLVYQNQLPLLKTTHRYRCDVIVLDHPTDLGLCYSEVTLPQLKNESFKVGLESFCWSSSVLLLLAVMSVLAAAVCTRVNVIACCRKEVIWKMTLVAESSQHCGGRMTTRLVATSQILHECTVVWP